MRASLFVLLLLLLAPAWSEESWITCLAYSPSGRQLAAGQADGTIRIWSAETEQGAPRKLMQEPIHGLQWQGEEGLLVWGGDRAGSYRPGPALNQTFKLPWTLLEGRFSPDRWLFFGTDRTQSALWQVATGKPVSNLKFPLERGAAYAFSPDSRRLFMSRGGAGVLFDCQNGRRVGKLRKGDDPIQAAAFTREGTLLTVQSQDVREWDPDSGREVRKLGPFPAFGQSLLLAPDGRRLLVGCTNAEGRTTLDFADRKTPGSYRRLPGQPLAVLPDGRVLCSDNAQDRAPWLLVYGAAPEPVRLDLPEQAHFWGVTVAVSPDGRTFAYVNGLSQVEFLPLPALP